MPHTTLDESCFVVKSLSVILWLFDIHASLNYFVLKIKHERMIKSARLLYFRHRVRFCLIMQFCPSSNRWNQPTGSKVNLLWFALLFVKLNRIESNIKMEWCVDFVLIFILIEWIASNIWYIKMRSLLVFFFSVEFDIFCVEFSFYAEFSILYADFFIWCD